MRVTTTMIKPRTRTRTRTKIRRKTRPRRKTRKMTKTRKTRKKTQIVTKITIAFMPFKKVNIIFFAFDTVKHVFKNVIHSLITTKGLSRLTTAPKQSATSNAKKGSNWSTADPSRVTLTRMASLHGATVPE